MTTPAGGNLVGDATINVNANTTAAALAIRGLTRDANGHLRDLRGRFVSESRLINNSLTTATRSAGRFADAVGGLRSASLLLSPALIPIAAQAAPIAAGLGAATVAVGAFAAAAAGQVAAISEASEAEKTYKDAVKEHGATSQEAAKAQLAFRRTVDDMPHPTRVAAGALSVLKDQYQEWSDSLAASTMPAATQSFAVFGALFPKLTPLVEGAGTQLRRFTTIAAGGVQSAGFDRFMRSFAGFATGAMAKANDALIRFTRTLDTGKISGGVAEFMEYARANGPLVRDVLSNVAQALGNILEGAANVGPGLLAVVNALAGIVAAVPPGVITAMLQMAIALKAVRLAALGMAAASGGMAAFATAIGAMRVAAAGATGVLPRLGAAIATLSRTAKVALAGTGIGLLVIALTELSQRGRQAPPDVDKLTSSLARLGKTGKVAGEGARAFGRDLDGLYGKVRSLTDPGTADQVQQFLVGWTGWDSTPVKEAKENLDAVDTALANLVKNGQSDLAAAALKRLTAEYGKGGRDTKEFTSRLGDYKAALADAKFEQQLAADAMGLFGQQAQQTSAKLAEQKMSADGLRQAIQAVNDVNRAGLGGMIAFEASIDAAAKAAQENAGSLRMVGGQLDLNSPKAQAAATALQDLAAKTDAAAGAAREQGQSWSAVNGIYERGRQQLIANAIQMGLTRAEAEKLASQILKTPNKTALLKADITDWKTKIGAAEKQLKTAKGDKKAKLTADIADWRAKVARAELQLKGTKATKRAKLTADITDWRAKVAGAERQLRTAKGSKKAKLTADIADWRVKVARAERQLLGAKATKKAKLTADIAVWRSRVAQASQQLKKAPASKRATLTANIDDLRRKVASARAQLSSIRSKSVTVTTFLQYRGRSIAAVSAGRMASGGLVGYASGGPVRGYPNGGPVRGPGTATSDSVPAMLSRGEFVVRAAAVRRYGVRFLEAMNTMRMPRMAAGGFAGARTQQQMMAAVTKAVQEALSKVLGPAIRRAMGDGLLGGVAVAGSKAAAAAKKSSSAAGGSAGKSAAAPRAAAPRAAAQRVSSSPATGFGAATAELRRLVDSGRWRKGGSMLFEDVSFQGMSKNFQKHQMKIADGFWAAIAEIKKAVRAGKKVFEDMTFKGMSGNVKRFHDMIAQVWKGNPYGRNFGDWGNFGSYGRYGKYAGGGLIQGRGTGTSDSVPVLASDGEYMIRAAAVRHYGVGLFDQLNSMTTRSPRTTASPAADPPAELHIHLHNTGVIGSQLELDNWLAKSMDRLNRTNRLPAARRP